MDGIDPQLGQVKSKASQDDDDDYDAVTPKKCTHEELEGFGDSSVWANFVPVALSPSPAHTHRSLCLTTS